MLRIALPLLLLAACSPSDNPDGAGGAAPIAAADTAGAVSLGATGERLAPGRYTRDAFAPSVFFEVGEGWTAAQVAAGFFDVQQDVGSLDVIAVQFGNVAEDSGAAAALSALRQREHLTVTQPETVHVGGRPGVRVVVETTDPATTQPPVFREVLRVTAGPIGIASARRLQVTFLDTSAGVLAILVGGSVAQWARTLEVAQPVVESVRIVER